MKLRLLIGSLNLIAIKAHGPGIGGPGPCDKGGVKSDADGNCVDINECETGAHNCPSDHVCFNLDATKSSGTRLQMFYCQPAWLHTTSSLTNETTAPTKTTATTRITETTRTTANTTTQPIHNETETTSQAQTTAQVETITKDQTTTQVQTTANAGITTKMTIEIFALIVAIFLFC